MSKCPIMIQEPSLRFSGMNFVLINVLWWGYKDGTRKAQMALVMVGTWGAPGKIPIDPVRLPLCAFPPLGIGTGIFWQKCHTLWLGTQRWGRQHSPGLFAGGCWQWLCPPGSLTCAEPGPGMRAVTASGEATEQSLLLPALLDYF